MRVIGKQVQPILLLSVFSNGFLICRSSQLEGNNTVTFPISFQSHVTILLTVFVAHSNPQYWSRVITSQSLTGFTCNQWDNFNTNYYWLAMGS